MKTETLISLAALCAVLLACTTSARADTLTLKDGTVIENCYVRDEGVRLLVWKKLEDAGTSNYETIPRTMVEDHRAMKIERADDWDAHPDKPDLSVTFIEMNPKLAGLHGSVQYIKNFTMRPGGFKAAVDVGDGNYLEPEKIVQDIKLNYEPGEEITLTAHVRNFGFADAQPFEYIWLIDGQEVERGKYDKKLKEMGETTFELKWNWQDGFHHVTFKIVTGQPEVATINNEATDPLWGLGLIYIVSEGRCRAWHQTRSAYGTFSWEDFYRWHIDIMNLLFQASKFPSSPDGIKARVRLDRIIYTDDPKAAGEERHSEDGIAYDQGAWVWNNNPKEAETGVYYQTDKVWRNRTEWSLPHELGHQLGLTDWYWLDEPGVDYHVWPDTGEKICHFQKHPYAMMHWPGASVFNEVDAGYLNQNWNKPRGYFADHSFAIPDENFLRIVDVNGQGVPGAKVEIFQRGVVVDETKEPGEDHGVTFYYIVDDGNMNHPTSKHPVIVGETDELGVIRLPNRPVVEVKTLNGFHRKPNPWGNIDPNRPGLMMVRVTKYDRPVYFWLEYFDYNVAWFRGQKKKFEITLKTPYGSEASPPSPLEVKAEQLDTTHVKVTWQWRDPAIMEATYLNKAIAFRVYRRCSNHGLNDRPWFVVATLGPKEREFVVDLTQRPEDMYFYGDRNRFAVSTLGETSIESELVEAPPLPK